MIKCVICGTKFKPVNARSVYCSGACRVAAHRKLSPSKESPNEEPVEGGNDFQDRMNKKYGPGTVRSLEDALGELEVLPTGSIGLDLVTDVGGWPRGRISEIYGPSSVGKTTLALHAILEAQKQGLRCAFIDTEHALNPEYAKTLGVDMATLEFAQPDYGELALTMVQEALESGYGLVVLDSVAATLPKDELEGEMGQHHVGRHARLMGQAMRKLTPTVSRRGAVLLFINQLRQSIGLYGPPEFTPGGLALKFYSSLRVELRTATKIMKGTEHIGNTAKAKMVKNKVGYPFRQTEFDIRFGSGIDRTNEVYRLAKSEGLISRASGDVNELVTRFTNPKIIKILSNYYG